MIKKHFRKFSPHLSQCFGCEERFKTRKALKNHQGRLWPGCQMAWVSKYKV